MAKKFDASFLYKRMDEEKAAREEREAKANIDWHERLKLRPWETFKNVNLPDEYFESQLIKLANLQNFPISSYHTLSEILAMSSDYTPHSIEIQFIQRDYYLNFFLADGTISPLFPAIVSSVMDIAIKDAQEKRTKTMKEWRDIINSLKERMLPIDEKKINMNSEILSLKLRILELEGKLKEAESLDKRRIEEIDRWHTESETIDNEAEDWHAKYEAASEALLKAVHERNVYKKMLDTTSGVRKFTVRQTAIIAFALCRKGGFIPKNKKSISTMFQDITGRSANTLGTNLCSSYTDDEIEEIAVAVEKDMPEFASYLRERLFSCLT